MPDHALDAIVPGETLVEKTEVRIDEMPGRQVLPDQVGKLHPSLDRQVVV